MVVGEAKELISVRRGDRGRATVTAGSETSSLPVSRRRSLHGFRATTQQWVEDTTHCREDMYKTSNCAYVSRSGTVSRSPSKKEGRIQFKQENDHSVSKLTSPLSSFAPSAVRKDGYFDAKVAALSPISLNSLPGFRQGFRRSNSTSKPAVLPYSNSHHQTHVSVLDVSNTLTDGKILLQQAVPYVKNEGGERKVVWCNPTFCEDSDDRYFSNNSATSAHTTTTHRSPPGNHRSVVELREGRDLIPPQEIRRQPMVVVGQDEKPSSSPLNGQINNGVNFPEKFTAESNSSLSVGAEAGNPVAVMMSTPEGRRRSLRAHFELESNSGNWNTPTVMSSITPKPVANSRCLDRVIDCLSTRTKRTLAQLPTLKDTSSQAFFSSTANHHLSRTSVGLVSSTKDDTVGKNYQRRPHLAYRLNCASETTTSDCGGSDRRSSRKLAMQPVLDEEAVKSQKYGSMADKPMCKGGDVTSFGRAQGPPQIEFEAKVEADLEVDIARETEEEIAKEILDLSQKLATLHVKQEQRRVACGENVGHSCPQTPLRCALSPAQTPPLVATSAIDEEKKHPISEPKRRSGRVVAAKFSKSATTERKVTADHRCADRNSRRRLLADSSLFSLPRRRLGTPARLLAKSNPLLDGGRAATGGLDHYHTEQGLSSKCLESRAKISAEEYVRERSSADGRGKNKSAVLKQVFREDWGMSRLAAASSHNTCNLERPHHHAPSLSIGSAVQSRYFLDFERKIDWVKTLRSDTVLHSTVVPLNRVRKLIDDDFVSRQTCKDVQSIRSSLGENHGSVTTEKETSKQETEYEPIHPSSSSGPMQRRDNSSSHTPRLKGRATQQQPRHVSLVSPSVTTTKVAQPCTTPTQNTQSSVVAAQGCSPSIEAKSVPSRYETPVRINFKAPITSDLKGVADPKLVSESPVQKIDQALRSAGKESGSSFCSKGRALVRKPTTRKDYPCVAGLIFKTGSSDTDPDVHGSKRHHHHLSPVGKAKDKRSTGGSTECMKRKDNFEVEYERFIEGSEIVEKQVSVLYHAAMDNVSAVESSPESEAIKSKDDHSSSARPAAAKRIFIKCRDLVKDKVKPPIILRGKHSTDQSVLPPANKQYSNGSTLTKNPLRTEYLKQDLERELITDERGAEEQEVENLEIEVTKDVDRRKQIPVWNGSAIDASVVGTLLQSEEILANDRQRLLKMGAKNGDGQQSLYEDGKGESHWHCSDNGGLWPYEVEGLDLESFWCLVGEVEASIMVARP